MVSLNETPRAERVHIALFGITNAGKSSLINALTDQEIALVSDVKGTTTDPVYKAMELSPIGPVVLIDTAGLDDRSELGELRKEKTLEVLNKTDVAILVCDAQAGITDFDREILQLLKEKKIPLVGVINKLDLLAESEVKLKKYAQKLGIKLVGVSTYTGEGLKELKEALIKIVPEDKNKFSIIGD